MTLIVGDEAIVSTAAREDLEVVMLACKLFLLLRCEANGMFHASEGRVIDGILGSAANKDGSIFDKLLALSWRGGRRCPWPRC